MAESHVWGWCESRAKQACCASQCRRKHHGAAGRPRLMLACAAHVPAPIQPSARPPSSASAYAPLACDHRAPPPLLLLSPALCHLAQVDVDVLRSVLSDSDNNLQKVSHAVRCGTVPVWPCSVGGQACSGTEGTWAMMMGCGCPVKC